MPQGNYLAYSPERSQKDVLFEKMHRKCTNYGLKRLREDLSGLLNHDLNSYATGYKKTPRVRENTRCLLGLYIVSYFTLTSTALTALLKRYSPLKGL